MIAFLQAFLKTEVNDWSEMLQQYGDGWRKSDGWQRAVMSFILFSVAMGKCFYYGVMCIYVPYLWPFAIGAILLGRWLL